MLIVVAVIIYFTIVVCSVIKYSICLLILIDETVLIYESYQVDRYVVDADVDDKIVIIM